MKPPHWWLGVPQVRAARPDRDWLMYPMLACALLLIFVVWASGWSHPTTARADLAEPHVPQVRATGAASDRAIGAGGVATQAAAGAAPVQSMRLPDAPGGNERMVPVRAPAKSYLARLDDLGAVTGDLAIALDASALGGSAGGAAGGEGYGFADHVRMQEITEPVVEVHSSSIGSGYGCGCGIGGMRGRSASVPSVRIGQPETESDHATEIRRYVKRNAAKISYCYEKELLAQPSLVGTVETHFTIERDGTVSGATATGVDDVVAACIAGVLANIQFPKWEVPAEVSYPFTLRPSGG